MKLAAKLKLVTDAGQKSSLLETLERANDCCNWISEQAWEKKTFGQYAIHAICYHEAKKKFGLTAQVVVRAIAKVSDAYAVNRKHKARFRCRGTFPYDRRILRFYEDQHVSIWTIHGRRKLAYECGPRQAELMVSQLGETDLLYHKGEFYLIPICNVDDPPLQEVNAFLGIDLGVKIIAASSDGKTFSGSHITNVRCRHSRLRAKLQKCGSRSAKRHLKKLSGKEERFARDTNHVISKQIIECAKRTRVGVAIEELTGIRSRIRARRKQRGILHSWAFAQLREFLTYKAILAGIPLITVDPRNSSRECSACGHISKSNRLTQSKFACRSCGHSENADINAAKVISGRGATRHPIAARSL
jgi:putative transposase